MTQCHLGQEVRQRGRVVEVEVRDQQHVHSGGVNLIEERKGRDASVSGVDSTVELEGRSGCRQAGGRTGMQEFGETYASNSLGTVKAAVIGWSSV